MTVLTPWLLHLLFCFVFLFSILVQSLQCVKNYGLLLHILCLRNIIYFLSYCFGISWYPSNRGQEQGRCSLRLGFPKTSCLSTSSPIKYLLCLCLFALDCPAVLVFVPQNCGLHLNSAFPASSRYRKALYMASHLPIHAPMRECCHVRHCFTPLGAILG